MQIIQPLFNKEDYDLLIEIHKKYEPKILPKEYFEPQNYSYHNNEKIDRIFMRQVEIMRYNFLINTFGNGNKL